MADVDVFNDLDLSHTQVWRPPFSPGADAGGAVLLTAASWVLQRLPVRSSRGSAAT